MDTATDQHIGHQNFGPSFSTLLNLVMISVIAGGFAVYLKGIAALPFVATLTAVYVASCAAGFPSVRVTGEEIVVRYLLSFRPKRIIKWADVERYVSTPIRGASRPFFMQLHVQSGKTLSIIAPTLRDPIELDQAICDRLPRGALTSRPSRMEAD